MVAVPFGAQNSEGKFGPDGGALLKNCYIEEAPPELGVPIIRHCRPGLSTFSAAIGSGGFRGGIELGGFGYVNVGSVVYRVDQTGNRTQIGGFPGSGFTRFTANQASPPQITLVSGGNRAVITVAEGDTEDDVLTTIADTDLPPPIDVLGIGNRSVYVLADGRFFWSAALNAASITATDFKTAESDPDGLIGGAVRQEEILLFGGKTTEFFGNVSTTAVFERTPNTTLQLGCLAGGAIRDLNGIVIFPASDQTVRQMNGYAPERISIHDVERDIRALADKSTMTAHTFSQDGHQYYCLNSDSWSWVCDLTYRTWFKWESYQRTRWRGEGSFVLGDKLIVGDSETTALYELDPTKEDDAGDALIWELISAPIQAFPDRVEMNALDLALLPGSGLNSTNQAIKNPKVMISVSIDDGKSFGTERQVPVGKIGEFTQEVSEYQFGTSNRAGFRVKVAMSAPVTRALVRADATVVAVDG